MTVEVTALPNGMLLVFSPATGEGTRYSTFEDTVFAFYDGVDRPEFREATKQFTAALADVPKRFGDEGAATRDPRPTY